jgi:hypothetical protein
MLRLLCLRMRAPNPGRLRSQGRKPLLQYPGAPGAPWSIQGIGLHGPHRDQSRPFPLAPSRLAGVVSQCGPGVQIFTGDGTAGLERRWKKLLARSKRRVRGRGRGLGGFNGTTYGMWGWGCGSSGARRSRSTPVAKMSAGMPGRCKNAGRQWLAGACAASTSTLPVQGRTKAPWCTRKKGVENARLPLPQYRDAGYCLHSPGSAISLVQYRSQP